MKTVALNHYAIVVGTGDRFDYGSLGVGHVILQGGTAHRVKARISPDIKEFSKIPTTSLESATFDSITGAKPVDSSFEDEPELDIDQEVDMVDVFDEVEEDLEDEPVVDPVGEPTEDPVVEPDEPDEDPVEDKKPKKPKKK